MPGMYWKEGDKRLAPFRIPGLELWASSRYSRLFQDSAGTTVANVATEPVGMIADLSGKGNHALQTTSGWRPTLTETGGELTPVYNKIDDVMAVTSTVALSTVPFTVFVRFRFNTPQASLGFIATKIAASLASAWALQLGTDSKLSVVAADTSSRVVGQSGALSVDTSYVAALRITSAFAAEAFLGGVSLGTFALSAYLANDSFLYIGGARPGVALYGGAVTDVIQYSADLNDGDMTAMSQWLNQ